MSELRGVTVLVVEDDQDTREVLKVMLEMCGARVLCAESARDGLSAFTREHPQAIVSDIAMPGEDGFELLRRVLEDRVPGTCRIPVLALTAYAGADDRRAMLDAGFRRHVPKPVEPAHLAALIAEVARERAARELH